VLDNFIDEDRVDDEEESEEDIVYDYSNEKPIDEDYEDEEGYEYEESDDSFCD
jgi:hypothetical protein